MLAGGLFADWFSVKSQMLIAQGETKNYSEDLRRVELVFVDDADAGRILTIPEARLRQGGDAASDSPDALRVAQGGAAAQSFSFAGARWHLEMRPVRYYKPYSITLRQLIDERYPGTDIPKNSASQITLRDPAHAVDRDGVISMNHPFRYAGETYYQSGFSKEAQSSMIEVVHNPGFVAPYVASVIIGFGLLIRFCQHFVGFTRRANDLRVP